MVKKMAVKNRQEKNQTQGVLTWAKVSMLPVDMSRICLLLFVAALVFFVLKTPSIWSNVWPVKQLTVIGSPLHIDKKQIAKLLVDNKLGGMLAIDLDELRRDVLNFPWVKNVMIQKKWPDTLVFNIEEFNPIALINGKYLIETGSLVEEKNKFLSKSLLQLEVVESKSKDLVKLTSQLELIQTTLKSHQLVIDSLNIDQNDSWSIKIKNKFVLEIGRKKQFQRINRFLQVYAAIENKNRLLSIDLRYSNGLAVQMSQISKKVIQNG